MRRIYVVMVADLFHYGHVAFLERARAFGDYLIVGLTSDENAARKKRRPILSWEERKKVVEACRYVDEVWLHQGPLCDAFMERNHLSLRVYAPKDAAEEQERLERYRRNGLKPEYLRRIEYTQSISTTDILQRIAARNTAPRAS